MDSVSGQSANRLKKFDLEGSIRMTMAVQETAQRVRLERHAVDELDNLKCAW